MSETISLSLTSSNDDNSTVSLMKPKDPITARRMRSNPLYNRSLSSSNRRSGVKQHSTQEKRRSHRNRKRNERTWRSRRHVSEFNGQCNTSTSEETNKKSKYQTGRKKGKRFYCDRFLQCMSRVPIRSLIAWLMLVIGLGTLTGSLLIGVQKTRSMLNSEEIFWYMDVTLPCVVIGMFILGTTLLCLHHLSTDPASRSLLYITGEYFCAKKVHLSMTIISYTFGLLWIVITTAIAVPLMYLVTLVVLTDQHQLETINLRNYGLGDSELYGKKLATFVDEGKDLIVSYILAYVSSLLITLSLIPPSNISCIFMLKLIPMQERQIKAFRQGGGAAYQ